MRLRALAMTALMALPVPAVADSVTVGGHDIWYQVTGDLAQDAVPALLLHGGMMNTGLAFGDLIPLLAADRPVIGIDQQGHGHTADRPLPITLDTMRTDTLAVLDALDVQRVHVIGFSLGGMLALDLAVNVPDRLASATLISSGQSREGLLPELAQMNRDPNHTPSPELVPLLPSAKDFLEMRRGYEDLNPDGSGVMVPVAQKLGALLTSDWGFDDDRLAGIPVPVMIAIGDRDFIQPSHAVQMAEAIPGAWLTILPDTKHMTIVRKPELSSLLLRRIETAKDTAP